MPAGTRFALVDAFTKDRAFSGNPAGVLLLEAFPDPAWMQGVANELHQAETAFLVPGDQGELELRWFTPVAEVAFAGTPRWPAPTGCGRPASWTWTRPLPSPPAVDA